MSDTKNVLKTGVLGNAGIGMALKGSDKWSVGVEGFYGSADYKSPLTGSTNLYAALVDIWFSPMPKAKLSPYIVAGYGVLGVKPDNGTSKSKGAYQIEGGVNCRLNAKWGLWADVRYMGSGSGNDKLTFLPITVGLSYDIK